jgi:hypothetical protein
LPSIQAFASRLQRESIQIKQDWVLIDKLSQGRRQFSLSACFERGELPLASLRYAKGFVSSERQKVVGLARIERRLWEKIGAALSVGSCNTVPGCAR